MSAEDLAAFIELRDGFLAQAEAVPRRDIFERALIANDAVEQALTSRYANQHQLSADDAARELARCTEVKTRIADLKKGLTDPCPQ